ncbi:MAG: hypothetical protein SPI30_01830 [Prevotella sp.]|nr:hypothetical protein [Prevotella sp.]
MRKKLLLSVLAIVATTTFAQQMKDSDTHSPYIAGVDEYMPAPGQFVNLSPRYEEGDDAAAMAAKCSAKIADNRQGIVTLGAFGGYITFHFDHSIANIAGQPDLYIMGNAFQAVGTDIAGGSSEPGVVMISKDVNRNGMPDDAWYEIAGSIDRDSVGRSIFGYEVTYIKSPMQDIPWTDNQGESGVVGRNVFHEQEYFPLWLGSSLTLKGTLLPKNAIYENGEGKRWIQLFFDYGYVDNKPNQDTLACSIDIDWAVDPVSRDTVHIDFVDFVRVYSGQQQMCGMLGETSTEICGAEDLHLEASIQAIKDALVQLSVTEKETRNIVETARFTLDGQRITTPQKGINVVKMCDGRVRKVIVR